MEHIGSSLRKLAESRGLEITSSKQTLKKVEGIELVRQQRAENRQDLIYSARPFALCGMPLKRPPAGTLIRRRRNGRFFLQIHGHAGYGLPFGQDRLVAIWAATQAVRQRSRIVEFESGAQILEEFGLPHNGVSYRRLTDGFKRVFGSTIYFGSGDDSGRQDVFDCARFCFFDRLRVWYSREDRDGGNLARLPNSIELSEKFWEESRMLLSQGRAGGSGSGSIEDEIRGRTSGADPHRVDWLAETISQIASTKPTMSGLIEQLEREGIQDDSQHPVRRPIERNVA